jgi:hypothetical protein
VAASYGIYTQLADVQAAIEDTGRGYPSRFSLTDVGRIRELQAERVILDLSPHSKWLSAAELQQISMRGTR